MRNPIKYLATRLVLIIVLFFALNELYLCTIWKYDVRQHASTFENLMAIPLNSEAIYFGESSNFHMTENDKVKHRISFILDDLIPSLKIATCDNSGLHAGSYFAYIQNISTEMKNLRYLIVTMNLRSFNQVWINSPFETNLAKEIRLIQKGPKLWNRFLVALNHYDVKSNKDREDDMLRAFAEDSFYIEDIPYHTIASWDKAIAWREWHGPKKIESEEEISLAAHYVKNFAFQINFEKNQRVKDFDNIVKWGKENNVKILFHILGENIEEAGRLIGPSIPNLLRRNADLLKERYKAQGAIVIDCLDDIPDSCFVDRNWPTEHYNLTGKKIIARKIASYLNKEL